MRQKRISRIGWHVKQLRKSLHLSQTAFAKRCGISQAHLSRIEKNDGNLTMDTLYRIANAAQADLHIEFRKGRRR